MAQATDIYAPSVAQDPNPTTALTAGRIEPMQNYAPQQQQQMGQAAMKVGETTDNIGERIQWQLDDAKTKAAETQFLQQAQPILHGDGTADNPGYLNLRGQTAIDGFDDASTALAKAKAQAYGSLDNKFQQYMFNRVTTAHLMNFGAAMSDHRFQQNAQFSAQASHDRSQSLIKQAVNNIDSIGQVDQDGNPTGNYNAMSQQAIQEAQHEAFIATGAGPKDPQGVAAAQSVTTQIALGVVTKMIDAHNYKGAQAYFDSEDQQGRIDGAVARELGSAIKRNTDSETIKDVANKLMDNLLRAKAGQPTGIDAQLPIQGGSYTVNNNDDKSQTFVVPQGTAVTAAADGKVGSITQDKPGGPYTVEVTHSDGSTTQYGNLSAVNYKAGDSVMQGQQPIGLTAKGGLDYSMADKDGKAVDPASQILPAVNRTKFADPADAQTVIDQINKTDYPPEMKAQMASYVDGQQKINFRQVAENKAQVVQGIQDAFYRYGDEHNGPDGPKYSMNALTPTQQQQLEAIDPQRLAQFKGMVANGSPKIDNTDILAGFILHPDTLTVANVQAQRNNLTPARYLSLLSDAKSMMDAPQKRIAISMDNDQLDHILLTTPGLNRLVNPQRGSQDQADSVQLRTAVRDQIDLNQRIIGRELTREQTRQVMIDMAKDNVSIPGIFSKPKVSALVSPDDMKKASVKLTNGQVIKLADIPASVHDSLAQSLEQSGYAASQGNIAALWNSKGRPKQ
jgi:hypothetical protein